MDYACCRVALRNWLFLEKRFDYLLYITWSVPWNYRLLCIQKQDTASNVELSNNETHLFQNGECSNEVEYHPRAILYAFARVRVSWSCVWSCACGVRCLLSAKLQNELGKLMQLFIYRWDLYHRQWCVSWVFVSVLLVELGMTCVLVWGNWFWSVYTTKKSYWNIWTFHFSASILCVTHLRGDLWYQEKAIPLQWQVVACEVHTVLSMCHFNLSYYSF